MKFRLVDRLMSAVVGLIVLFLGVCLFVFGLGIFPFKFDASLLETPFVLWQRLVMVAIAALLCVLGVHSLLLMFRRSKEKGFIMQQTELGDMSISMHAMESMVKRCIDTHEELKVTQTRIRRMRDGVGVAIRVSLANGVNIPLTVNALQKQIKHYITSCSGVDVKEVRVMVETNNSQQPKSAEVVAPDLLAADASVAAQGTPSVESTAGAYAAAPSATDYEAEKEPFHQRIFKPEETQQIVPPPPVEETIQTVADIMESQLLEDQPQESLQTLEAEAEASMPEDEGTEEWTDQQGEEEKEND